MKNIILGINTNHADSSACIIIDGKLEAAIEEERINRIKHWAGFPEKSIISCLNQTNINFNDVTDVTINTNPFSNIIPKSFFFLKNYLSGSKKYEILKRFKKKINLKQILKNKFGNDSNFKIHYIDHHISHISSAFYMSEFDKSLGLSIDGFGDFTSLMIADCNRDKISVNKKILFPNSLGVFFEAMTQLSGFKKFGEEYKAMGLSAFGQPVYYDLIKEKLFKEFGENFKLNLNYFNFYKKNFNYNFEGIPDQENLYNESILKIFDKPSFKNLFDDKNFTKNLTSSAQKIFEDLLIEILKKNKKNNKNLSFSGGCALNSLANGKIISSQIFDNIFIPYCPGDNGGAIGSAMYLYKKKFPKNKLYNAANPYLGPSYNEGYILKILKEYNQISYKNFSEEELIDTVATKLKEKKIIGWFQDKMEFGPRALGNRSIISSPIGSEIQDLINIKIKRREKFRPFAPVVLEEKILEWFEHNIKSKYMSYVVKIKKEKRNIIPAVVHVDGTGRLQTLNRNQNKKFYKLINAFFKKTNVPIILNTSFNENEPIVMKPEEAIQCFLRTQMDFLVINNFLISKKI